METFVTIATFNYPHEITILRHHLELSGIPFYFENEATASIVPMYSIALGGIKLKVHHENAMEAKQILDDFFSNESYLNIV